MLFLYLRCESTMTFVNTIGPLNNRLLWSICWAKPGSGYRRAWTRRRCLRILPFSIIAGEKSELRCKELACRRLFHSLLHEFVWFVQNLQCTNERRGVRSENYPRRYMVNRFAEVPKIGVLALQSETRTGSSFNNRLGHR